MQNLGKSNWSFRNSWLPSNDKLVNVHHYQRFITEETELWCFGAGLGDQTVIQQVGLAFLEVAKEFALGKIMLSFGSTLSALHPYKGDFNVWWSWGDRPDYVDFYLQNAVVKPSLCLALSRKAEKEMAEKNLHTLHLPLGVGAVFHPLNLERKGFGYAGLDIKSEQQKTMMLKPFLNNPEFEWHGKGLTNKIAGWFTLEQLNEWYNRKLIVFGMINERSVEQEFLPNRVYETLASGTPLVFPRIPAFKTFTFDYPYLSSSVEETVEIVKMIQACPEKHLKRLNEIAVVVQKNHNYEDKVRLLLKTLGGS